jgi:membrane-bound lytic murein transglycosylase D
MIKFVLTCLLALLLTGCASGPPSGWTLFQRKIDHTAGDNDSSVLGRVAGQEERVDSCPTEEDLLTSKNLFDLHHRGESEEGKKIPDDGRPLVNFELPLGEHERVDEFVRRYTDSYAGTFQRRLERSGRFVPLMRKIFAEEGLPEDLVYVAMIESGFQENALSWAQASGPWQFMESTGRLYGLKNDAWRDERRDPIKSTRAAACHLKNLYQQFGDWNLALAAYNAGAGKIQQAIRDTGSSDFWAISQGKCLQNETQEYVPKFLASLKIVREPERYGFDDVSYQDPLIFDTVTVNTATDLAVIARLCSTSLDEIRELNPELKRWCTPPGLSSYQVRIPPGTAEQFKKRYAALSEEQRGRFKRHKIKRGETLLAIARHYHLSTTDILELNHISNPRLLRVGAVLVLPLPEGGPPVFVAEVKQKPVRTGSATYVVRQGDSVYQIARTFGISQEELVSWNRLGRRSLIHPGQTLVVTRGSAPKTAAKAAKKAPERTSRQAAVEKTAQQRDSKGRKVVYHVRSGDTLWKVSRQFKVATQDILEWNHLSDQHVLKAGEDLTLHLDGEEKG